MDLAILGTHKDSQGQNGKGYYCYTNQFFKVIIRKDCFTCSLVQELHGIGASIPSIQPLALACVTSQYE